MCFAKCFLNFAECLVHSAKPPVLAVEPEKKISDMELVREPQYYYTSPQVAVWYKLKHPEHCCAQASWLSIYLSRG